jgi:hypothetical protein
MIGESRDAISILCCEPAQVTHPFCSSDPLVWLVFLSPSYSKIYYFNFKGNYLIIAIDKYACRHTDCCDSMVSQIAGKLIQ